MPASASDWAPEPIDTSDIHVPSELLDLVETLAENNHNVWADLRLREGWRYGPGRDSAARTNPTLVPYAELPENEKDVDRTTALELVKLVMKLGYRIAPHPRN